MLETLYASGLRVTELVTLKVPQLSLDLGVVRVMGKGSKERVVPFGVPAKRALGEWLRVRDALAEHPTAFFVGAKGQRLTIRTVYELVSKLLDTEPGSGPSCPPSQLQMN